MIFFKIIKEVKSVIERFNSLKEEHQQLLNPSLEVKNDERKLTIYITRMTEDQLDGGRVHLNWLEENFADVPENAPEEILKRHA
ncbi:hypothetical protein V6N12_073544 [Hibiscus sabdariffa]|uniref:Uncharacterized protein n=1 Tax=Hibiscus sabdariffa TaxID=183260 RepID=A0ABR2BHS1_9ROSI